MEELGNKKVPIGELIETEKGQRVLESLAKVYENSGQFATVIMCAERDNKKCHRYIVCQRLLDDYGIHTMHIGYNGTIENHANQGM